MSNLFPVLLVAGAAFALYQKSKTSAPAPSYPKVKTQYRVALFKSIGVSNASFDVFHKLLSEQQNIDLKIVTAEDIRQGELAGQDVILMGGGSGSQQGKDLGDIGKQKIKTYVKNGGCYIGICGGAYLALQSTQTYSKLDLVASKNFGDHWQRGVATCPIKTNDGREIPLHYENGPLFDTTVHVKNLAPFVTLGTFGCDIYKKGKKPGQMPGKPAIIVSKYGKGRVLLFSPNPLLGGHETYYPELILNGINYVVNHKSIPKDLSFGTVFG